MFAGRRGTLARWLTILMMGAVLCLSLTRLDAVAGSGDREERLYFPSGKFLCESSLGFQEVAADFLWFRFVQYYGAFAKGHNDLRYFELLIDAITRLDPRFDEAYHFASLVLWSDFGDFPASIDILKRGILHNPDAARLPFTIGFTYYVFDHDYPRASYWFDVASRCADATDRERRFAAFSRFRMGDDRVSLELWLALQESTESPQMKELAEKMIQKLKNRISQNKTFGNDFVGPVPEL